MGIREENARLAEEKAAKGKAQRQKIRDQQARQRGYGNRGGSTYRTPAEQKVHLENMRKAQAGGATAGPDRTGGPRMSANEGAEQVNRAKNAPPNAGTQAPAPEGGESAKNPSTRERLSQKAGAARDKVNEVRQNVRESGRYQKYKSGAGKTIKGAGRGVSAVARGGARATLGTLRMASNPALWGAAGAGYVYGKGREHTANRLAAGEQLVDEYGAAAPSRGQMQPSAADTPFTEKMSTYMRDVGRAAVDGFQDPEINYNTVGIGPFARSFPELSFPGSSASDELFDADQARNEATLGTLREHTDTAGQAASAQADLRLIGQRIVDDGYVGALNDPKIPPSQKREIYADITRGLAARGVAGQAVTQMLFDSGVNPDFLQQVAEEVDPENVPLVGYDEFGNPIGTYEGDSVLQESYGPGASTQGVRQFTGPGASFTDLNARGSEVYNEGDYIPDSAAENEGNRRMRERLFDNTRPMLTEEAASLPYRQSLNDNLAQLDQLASDGKIKLVGGRTAAREFAAKMSTPEGRAELDLQVALKKSSDRNLPEMTGAELAALPLRERLGAIQDRRDAAQADIAERMSSRRWQTEIDQLADPNRTLRNAARTSQKSAEMLQEARKDAENTMRERVKAEYGLDISDQLEGTAIERRESEDYVLQRGARNAALKEFDEQIRGRAGDNVASGRAISSMARQSGISELVANGQLSSAEAEYQVANLYALDKMMRTFSKKTGKTVGVNVVQTFQEGGMPAVQDLFRSQFVEGGGDFYFDDPSLTGVLDGSEAGAVWDRIKSSVSAGLIGDSGVGTMMLRGPEGERISVEELFGGDPFMYETFINMIQDAQDK